MDGEPERYTPERDGSLPLIAAVKLPEDAAAVMALMRSVLEAGLASNRMEYRKVNDCVLVGSVELRLKVLWSLDIVEAERVRRRVSRLDSRVRVTFHTRPDGRCSTDSSDSLMRLIEAVDRATEEDVRGV